MDETAETELTEQKSLRLEIAPPDTEPYSLALDKHELVLGRSRRADVLVDHPSVSREHVRLRLRATIEVVDLGSGNGTRIRGKQVVAHQPTAVAIGEVIEIGRVVVRVVPDEPAGIEAWCIPSAPVMRGVLQSLERAGARDRSVLLLGERGIGTPAYAELVHRSSPRAERSFHRVDCGAGDLSLEAARGGTIFLDDVAALPAAAQLELQRVIDGRGPDVRVVVGAEAELATAIAQGRLRDELYYRIAAVTIRIPPLRERVGEIIPLATKFLSAVAGRAGRSIPALAVDACDALERHPWPGNIVELSETMKRAFAACAGTIRAQHLPVGDVTVDRSAGKLRDEVEDLERTRIESALVAANGNQSEAARRLGMSRGALLARLRSWGMTRSKR